MTVFERQIARSYQQEDIQQILNLAIARQSDGGEFSRQQLLEIAAELSISTESLIQAEQEWLLQQQQRQKHQEFNFYRRSQLKRRFGKYLIVNLFLVCLNLLTAGQLSWSLYILLFWGLGLGLHAWDTYQLQGEHYERAFQKWYRKHQLTQVAHSLYSRINNWLKAVS
ncbi:2TM domain-containing protein [Microcoleus sp. ZQ-A2]|jgi:hypothetical protein|nr:2TM domain-containing protein [Microcoleus sp. FACHB-1]